MRSRNRATLAARRRAPVPPPCRQGSRRDPPLCRGQLAAPRRGAVRPDGRQHAGHAASRNALELNWAWTPATRARKCRPSSSGTGGGERGYGGMLTFPMPGDRHGGRRAGRALSANTRAPKFPDILHHAVPEHHQPVMQVEGSDRRAPAPAAPRQAPARGARLDAHHAVLVVDGGAGQRARGGPHSAEAGLQGRRRARRDRARACSSRGQQEQAVLERQRSAPFVGAVVAVHEGVGPACSSGETPLAASNSTLPPVPVMVSQAMPPRSSWASRRCARRRGRWARSAAAGVLTEP